MSNPEKIKNSAATLADIARLAGVSPMTVSRVVNNFDKISLKTREKVNRAIEKTGYRPHFIARALARRNTYTGIIGLCVPFHRYLFTVDYFLRMFRAIEETLNKKGYNLLLFNTVHRRFPEKAGFSRLLSTGIADGFIIVAPHIDDENIPALQSSRVPFILLSSHREDKEISFIDADNIRGAFRVTEHLITAGHKRVAAITGDLTTTNALDRLKGYELALKKYGLVYDKNLVVTGDFLMDRGYLAMKKLLKLKERPGAVFCANDFMAVSAMQAIKEAGLAVPGDIAVAGYDDNDFAGEKDPPITSVRQPCDEMGRRAVNKLIEMINRGRKKPARIFLKNEMIIRGSSLMPPKPKSSILRVLSTTGPQTTAKITQCIW